MYGLDFKDVILTDMMVRHCTARLIDVQGVFLLFFQKSQKQLFYIYVMEVSLALHLIGPSFFELVSQRGTEL